MKKYMKTIFSLVLILLSMVLIFKFSSQNGNDTNYLSLKVTNKIASIVFKNYNLQSNEIKNYITYSLNIIIRKTAHFTMYYILGSSVYLLIFSMKKHFKKCFAFSLSIPLLYAISDELHQLFTNGRTAKVTDVIIDETGAFFGSLTVFAVIACFNYLKLNHTKKL